MNHDKAISLWINHINLLWSRLKTASAIEGASLAAAYKIYGEKHIVWAVILLVVATLLLFGVLLLMMRDVQYVDAIKTSVNQSCSIPEPPIKESRWHVWKTAREKDDKCFEWEKIGGRQVGFLMIVVLMLSNVIAIICFLCPHPTCQ
jgi:hypothetical protein